MTFPNMQQESYSLKVTNREVAFYEQHFVSMNLYSIASAQDDDKIKFYLYCRSLNETFQIELNLDFLEMELQLVIKSNDASKSTSVLQTLHKHLIAQGLIN